MPRSRLVALLLAVATLALYLPVAWFGFINYDDSLYVTGNPTVQAGVTWAGVKWAFGSLAACNWHPLTWLSHMVDCGLFGLNPAGPHLVNALFHAVNAALLFTLLRRLTNTLWPAAFVAALFAWHPMHVESVAWISERKDVLSTFFALLALLAYADYVGARNAQKPRAKVHFGWSLLLFALGLMAKPMLVTLPCVLLLLDFWPLGRIQNNKLNVENCRPLFAEKTPFFLIAAASCVVTFLAQSRPGGSAVVSLEIVPLHYRLKNVPVAYLEYLWKTFWPAKLAIFYPLPETIPVAQVAFAVTVLVGISLVVWRLHPLRPYLFTGWLWFVGMLVPVIGLVQVGGAALADRYSYLPSIGIFLMVTFAAIDLAARFRIPRPVRVGTAVFILAALVLTMETQLRHWQNNITLFQHALAVTTDNDISRNNLGVALENHGRLAEAAEQYRAAVRLAPARYIGHHNLANALDLLGQPKEALVEHREAVRASPELPALHYSLGLALDAAGQTDMALKELAEAARRDPDYVWPHAEIARIYLRQGRAAEALNELRAALQIEPDNIDLLVYTAQVLAAAENPAIRSGPRAFVLAARANLLAGGRQPKALDALGMACAEMGKFDAAQLAAQTAIDTATALKMTGLEPIRQRLELYKNHQPWRESFGHTNAPGKN